MKCRKLFMTLFAICSAGTGPNLASVQAVYRKTAKGEKLRADRAKPWRQITLTRGFTMNAKLVPTLLFSTFAIMSFAGRVVALSTCPNKSEQNTINLGIVTTNPYSACVGALRGGMHQSVVLRSRRILHATYVYIQCRLLD